jgi:hypothetical protein
LRGLKAEAVKGRWQSWAWRPFLWAAQGIKDTNSIRDIAVLLLGAPKEVLTEISDAASWWLNEKVGVLDDELLWSLWDRLEEVSRDLGEPNHE